MGRRGDEETASTGEVNAFIGKGTAFQGEIRFEGVLHIDGKYDGRIHSGESLVIAETAEVNAEITVNVLIVKGMVRGNITADSRVEITPSGEIQGDIQTPSLIIREGAMFVGNCKMER